MFAANKDDDDSPQESAIREFTMATNQTAMPLLATTDNDHTTPPQKAEELTSPQQKVRKHHLLCT